MCEDLSLTEKKPKHCLTKSTSQSIKIRFHLKPLAHLKRAVFVSAHRQSLARFKEEDAVEVAKLIVKVLEHPEDTAVLEEAKAQVKELTDKYPLY